MQHHYMNLPAKFDANRIINKKTAARNVKTRWRRRPSWIFGQHFRFCLFRFGHDIPYLCFKFHQNLPIFAWVIAIYVNPRWPPPPSCFLIFTSGFLFSLYVAPLDASFCKIWCKLDN
jgi:hypothetical protein